MAPIQGLYIEPASGFLLISRAAKLLRSGVRRGRRFGGCPLRHRCTRRPLVCDHVFDHPGLHLLMGIAVSPSSSARTIRSGTSAHAANLFECGERTYLIALFTSAIFQVVHLVFLPLVISPDGLEYVSLSRVLGSSEFLTHWGFFRMPLYPWLLRATFSAFGQNAITALIPGTALGFLGIWVLAFEVRRSAGPLFGAAVLVVLSIYPVLVAYQHTVLTEAGTFSLLAIIVALLLRLTRNGIRAVPVALLALALTAGYLFRATLIVIVPAAMALVCLVSWVEGHRSGAMIRSRLVARGIVCALLVGCLPIASWRLWVANGRSVPVNRAFGYTLLLYLASERVISVDDPMMAAERTAYQAAITTARPLSVLALPEEVLTVLRAHEQDGTSIFRRVIRSNPRGYLIGAARTAIVFAGIRTSSSDNHLFTSNVLSLSVPQSKCVCPTEMRGEFDRAFRRSGSRTPLHYLLKILYPMYGPLVVLGWLFTVSALLIGMWRLDLRLLVVSVVPITFAIGHIALVFGLDRFAVPIFPIVLANLCVVGYWIAHPPVQVVPES
jgi:4-amino-4-deoxy-L-arabinose transferase-like glycosyltransferase